MITYARMGEEVVMDIQFTGFALEHPVIVLVVTYLFGMLAGFMVRR